MARRPTTDVVPVLSPGSHRNPRRGGCFMEYASWLAGERWSDHPRCTHPLLAGVARVVNDHVSDSSRSRLIRMIPSVIGLTGDDPAIDAGIAMRCAAAALPVAAEHRQRALAAGLLTAGEVITSLGAPASPPDLPGQVRAALDSVPHATEWARGFTRQYTVTPKAFQRRSAPAIVRVAVVGIAEAATSDSDDRLVELLATVIDDCRQWLGTDPSHLVTQPASLVRATS